MKLLLDQHLSFRLCRRLDDRFPGSQQLRRLGLDQADDRVVWAYAAQNGFTIVTEDADFLALLQRFGPPPRVIRLRCGNTSTDVVERLLRSDAVAAFEADLARPLLELA